MLREIGEWLKTNGEAIYETRPWKTFGEGPVQVAEGPFGDTKRESFGAKDIRFTQKGDSLYAIALDWPEHGEVLIKSLAKDGELGASEVSLLGSDAKLKWSQTEAGLKIRMPAQKPGQHAFAFRIR